MKLHTLNDSVRAIAVVSLLLILVVGYGGAAGQAEAAAGSDRGIYLAARGQLIPPDEVRTENYIASIDYDYPTPAEHIAVYAYSGNRTVSPDGGPQLLHIGVKGSKREFEDLPPLNLAFVVDKGLSMADDDKIDWVKQSFDILIGKLRDSDFISLVVFDDDATVVFPSTRLDNDAKREALRAAVRQIVPSGRSNLEAGLEAGYQQVLANYRNAYTNRVLFLSDGTEMSARLRTAGADSGDLRVSLLWDNRNDVDLHVVEPSGEHVFYGNRVSRRSGGMLDVDMNVNGQTTKPVENVFWPKGAVPHGRIRVYIQLYGYHDPRGQDTNYTVEIYDRGEITRYDGVIPAFTPPNSNFHIAEIDFRPGSGSGNEVRGVLEVARTYKEMGISVSTIGVGEHFDLQLMSDLGTYGGGSSRFVANREKMTEIFDTELDRMIVAAATDVEIDVTLGPGVTLDDTWGYQHSLEGDTVRYRMETVHNGDYETILLRLNCPPIAGSQARLALVETRFSGASGERVRLEPIDVVVRPAPDVDPLAGVSTYRVVQSAAMLDFAESLKEIGEIFFSGPMPIDVSGEDVRTALELTRSARARLLAAQRRVDGITFEDELEILDHYFETLGNHPELTLEDVRQASGDDSLAASQTDRTTLTHLTNLFAEVREQLRGTEVSIAVAPFFVRTNLAYPQVFNDGMRVYVQQVATTTLAVERGLRVIDTDEIETELSVLGLGLNDLQDTINAIETARRLETDTIVTGTMIEMNESFIVFARVIDVKTEEVLAAAQVVMDKKMVLDDLLGPA